MTNSAGISVDKHGSGDGGDRGIWFAYLSTAAVLSVFRASLLVWWVHLTRTHQMNQTIDYLFFCLRPELLLGDYTRLGDIGFGPAFFLLWVPVLTAGSFLIASPILFLGRRWRRNEGQSIKVR